MPPETDSVRRGLARGLETLGVDASAASVERWLSLAQLLDRWSRKMNLTGHRGSPAIAHRLLLEAAALSRALPAAESIADLGSGAGIPGLPLALCRPDCRLVLVEARERRHHFQRAAIRELGLSNVVARRGRVEEIEALACEGVVSQAFAKASQALEWMLPWSRPGGWLAIATQPEAELHAVLSHESLDPGVLVPYRAPAWTPMGIAETGSAAAEVPGPPGPRRAVWLARRRTPANSGYSQ